MQSITSYRKMNVEHRTALSKKRLKAAATMQMTCTNVKKITPSEAHMHKNVREKFIRCHRFQALQECSPTAEHSMQRNSDSTPNKCHWSSRDRRLSDSSSPTLFSPQSSLDRIDRSADQSNSNPTVVGDINAQHVNEYRR